MQRWVWALAAVVLAGCFQAGDDAAHETGTDPLATLSVSCPAEGATRETNPSVCVGTVVRPDAWLAEPSLVVHPSQAGVMALGTNAVTALPGLPAGINAPSPGLLTALFLTQDAGVSWTQVALPELPGRVHNGDPTLVFAPDGRLFVGELSRASDGLGLAVHETPDLGRTWSTHVFQRDGGVDRPWLSVRADGRALVTWQTPQRVLGASWQDEGGAWHDAEFIADCNLQTAAVDLPEGPVVACLHQTEGAHFVEVHRLDLANATSQVLARLGGSSGTLYLGELRSGGLALYTQEYVDPSTSGRVWRSMDGIEWTKGPLDTRAAATLDDAWGWMWTAWMAPLPDGTLAALFVGGDGEPCFNGGCQDPAQARQVIVVRIGQDGRMEGEFPLTPLDPAQRERPAGSRLPLNLGDDFGSISTGAGGTWAAWGHDGGIDYVRLDLQEA